MPRSRRDGPGVAHRRVVPGREAEAHARPRATQRGHALRARARWPRRAPRAGRRPRTRTRRPGCRACTPARRRRPRRAREIVRHVDRVGAVAAGARRRRSTGPVGVDARPARTPSSMASTMPTSSSTVSPFIRRATTKAAIWAGLAAPSRISAIVARRTARVERPALHEGAEDDRPPAVLRRTTQVRHGGEPTAEPARRPSGVAAGCGGAPSRWRRPRRLPSPGTWRANSRQVSCTEQAPHTALASTTSSSSGGEEDLGVQSAACRVAAPDEVHGSGGSSWLGGQGRAQSLSRGPRGCKPIVGRRRWRYSPASLREQRPDLVGRVAAVAPGVRTEGIRPRRAQSVTARSDTWNSSATSRVRSSRRAGHRPCRRPRGPRSGPGGRRSCPRIECGRGAGRVERTSRPIRAQSARVAAPAGVAEVAEALRSGEIRSDRSGRAP